eukprot:2034606-Karenia_brevis.AAC.1
MDDDSAFFGDSEDSSGSMSSCSHEDSTDAEKGLIQDVLVETPPPEAVLLGTPAMRSQTCRLPPSRSI